MHVDVVLVVEQEEIVIQEFLEVFTHWKELC